MIFYEETHPECYHHAVVTVIMAVVLGLYIKYTGTVPAADNAASLTDGIYTSSAQAA